MLVKENPDGVLSLSVVIPAYNEEGAIYETVTLIHDTLHDAECDFEIIVVDDASTDGTSTTLDQMNITGLTVIRHTLNKGYGGALKTGVRAATRPMLVITDADGTYPNERIAELAARLKNKDMIVGARTGKNVRIPLIRRPAKWCIGKLANYLARYKIPDINSGLRVFKRETLLRYLNILPDGFSFTTTITLAMLTCGDQVEYTPIDYAHRVGKSKIKPIRDTLNFIQLIIRTILLFEPLRIFIPAAFFMFIAAVGVFAYSWLWTSKILDMTVAVLTVGSLQILATGMIADMINRRLGR
ncbi:MAG: glycosyltransferase family 2 protein [Deltaproteobacteria bacterium]|nr:glycosyltransferase family 2 protein [Deltaproteobacteria bacterium]